MTPLVCTLFSTLGPLARKPLRGGFGPEDRRARMTSVRDQGHVCHCWQDRCLEHVEWAGDLATVWKLTVKRGHTAYNALGEYFVPTLVHLVCLKYLNR